MRSGYLIEYRAESLLRKRGWYVEANSAYEDNETHKSREVDIYALFYRPVRTHPKDRLFSSVLIECVNNPQPIAFLTKKPHVSQWAVSDIKGVFDPEVVYLGTSNEKQNLGDLLQIGNYHHYCRGRIASQFCSFNFKTDKKEWMAWHDDTHFNAFSTLAKAVEYRFTQLALVPGTYISWEFINPVVLVQGELLDVKCLGKSVRFKSADHIKFRRTLIWKGEEKGYIIDVVTERAFPRFVAMLERELSRTASGVEKHIELLRATLRRKHKPRRRKSRGIRPRRSKV